MALTFTLWFPIGAIITYTTRNVWLHAAVQGLAYINGVAGMGLGIWPGRNVRYPDCAHTVISMAVMAALMFQVAFGVRTHWAFVAAKDINKEGAANGLSLWQKYGGSSLKVLYIDGWDGVWLP
jgi:hypothetical protein